MTLPALAAGASANPAPAGPQTILVYGDSLSAGYGIAVEKGWVQLLSDRLSAQGYGYRLVNASVSGETTTGGLARLPRALATHRPKIVMLELGANDGLRGLPLAVTRSNLEAMVARSLNARCVVILLGIRMPPNYGERYTKGFAAMFSELAHRHRVALLPFLLDGVAAQPTLMQPDGLHPNEHGQPVLLDNVWGVLKPLLPARQH